MNFNKNYLTILFAFVVLSAAFVIQSCDIKSPTAPNWDVSLNIPIAKKDYTMLDIIENKSSVIQHYTSGTNQNLLYYSSDKQLDNFRIGDKIKPDPNSTITPGAINISSDSIQTDIDLSWISPPVSPGTQTVMPAISETNMSGNFSLAEQFQTIKIYSGLIDVTFTNYFPSPVKITLSNIVLKNTATGEIIAQSSAPLEILPQQSSTRKSIPITPGVTVKNQLTLQAKISSTGSNGQQITMPSKSLSIGAKIYNLKVTEYSGKLAPTAFAKTRTAIGLDVRDIQNKLKFQQINLKNPKIELRLNLTADVEVSINGSLEARNSIGQRGVMTLSSRTLNKTIISKSDPVLILNPDSLSNFIKSFSQFPDSMIVFFSGIVNPNNKTITVTGNDWVTIRSLIEFPFEFGLSGGEFSDSVKVDFNNDDRKSIKDINSLGASLTITNGIPAQISFTAKLFDQNNKLLTYFPPKYQDQDTVIAVSGASVDANGNVISNTVQNVNVKTLKADIDKISNAYYMKVKVRLNTSGSTNQAVKFKTDNILKFIASGSANYHVNPEGK